MRFDIHDSDINAVRFFPSGEALGTACSDGTVRADIISAYPLVYSSIQQYTVVYINMQWCTIVCKSVQEWTYSHVHKAMCRVARCVITIYT